MTTETRPFWQTTPGKLVRWLGFLPLGILAASFLQGLPVLAVDFASAYKPEMNFLTIILAAIVVGILGRYRGAQAR